MCIGLKVSLSVPRLVQGAQPGSPAAGRWYSCVGLLAAGCVQVCSVCVHAGVEAEWALTMWDMFSWP